MKKKPCVLAHVLAVLCAVMLVAAVAACGLTWQVNRLLTDAELHESVALDVRVTDVQFARVENTVHELAAKYAFAPETVMDLVTRESLADYSREVIAWWMGLLAEDPVLDAPEWDTADVEQAVREDELFQANTPSTQRRSVARDQVAYAVGQAVDRAVLPVRMKLVAPLLPMVFQKVDVLRYMGYLSMAPAVLAGAAAVLCLVILLAMRRRLSLGMLYIGSGLIGGALMLALAGAAVFALNVTGQVAELSPIMGMQLSLLTKQLAWQSGLYALACLTVGAVLIGLYQACSKRSAHRQGSIAA